jgi:PAS domain S-box-containing protein
MTAEAAREELEKRVRERAAELSKANELLIDSEEQMRMLTSEVKDYAIFMLDPYGRVASWNEGAKRIEGYESEEILGKHFSIFYSAQERDSGKPDRELQEAVAKGHYTEEGPRVRKDGSTFWASLVITPLYDKSGKLRGYSEVTRDTSHRKKIEQELRTLAAVAQNIPERSRPAHGGTRFVGTGAEYDGHGLFLAGRPQDDRRASRPGPFARGQLARGSPLS